MICLGTIILSILLLNYGNSVRYLDLSDQKWVITEKDRNITLYVTTPISVHMALYQNSIIKNPLVGYRDVEYKWIADKSWSFKTEFTVSQLWLDSPSIIITFYGLDTVSTIYLNGLEIGASDNMFTSYQIAIKDKLRIQNVLEVVFTSPTAYSTNKSDEYFLEYGYKIPPVISPAVQHGRDHPNFIRKEQCSFSWDWGPSFPTIGIWKDVIISFDNFLTINDLCVHTTYHKESQMWKLFIDAHIESTVDMDILALFGYNSVRKTMKVRVNSDVRKVTFDVIEILKEDVEMWWPIGYGAQQLYTAHVQMINPRTSEFTEKEVQFGFRTVELVQETIQGSEGLSFYFKINGKDIFLKGANWIPADSFQERVTPEVIKELFNSTISANMNTLRVWGGGIYEQERFYELADEKGILIWQDLMFAVALYPVNRQFLSSVQKELLTQVRRLQHHPCLIAWSGNNENEAAIAQDWWEEVKVNKDRLTKDYIELYAKTVEPIIASEDPTRPFLMSSPSNGAMNKKEGYISKNPQSPNYGDVHFYNYKTNCMDVSMFPNPRFASEYGYQSYPSFITMATVASGDELMWNSSLMYHRQHHKNGNEEIQCLIEQHFFIPQSSQPLLYFKHMLYLSQVVQAMCVRQESEHYRRLQGRLENGTGHTMGTLYWQLNDIWQAPSWSSIEYGGRWKMLHYYARHFFAATTVSGYIQDGYFSAFVVSDHPGEITQLTLRITAYSWNSFVAVSIDSVYIGKLQQPSTLVYRTSLTQICVSPCIVQLEIFEKSDLLATTHVISSSFSVVKLHNPKLEVVSASSGDSTTIHFQVEAVFPAVFVWLETLTPGHFSDNGFAITKPYSNVTFYCSKIPIDRYKFLQSLTVTSLYDVRAT